ncbi:MAG: BlaI/MecI/CopY family transcriptional regulator [Lachnospiraceae bacterium]|nr:BlaI/MecI/CopY family transcriptional regulator [Lachnospiraceae bacterium]
MMSRRELDILNILWKAEQPMMATDIVNAGDGLTQSTVTAVLRKLLRENLIEVTGVTHSGKVLSRTYRPTEACKDAILNNFRDTYMCFRNAISISTLCDALLKTNEDDTRMKKDIAELKAVIKKYS